MAARKKRQRDYAAEYARRQERARALGHASYYQRRVAGVPKGERARVRGHRGAKDFLRTISSGDLVMLPSGVGSVERDAEGRYRAMTLLVNDAETGEDRTFTFRNFTREQLIGWIDAMDDADALYSPNPSQDVNQLVTTR